MGMDMNKLFQQVGQMQEQMQKAQAELANETVEATAGGGMVTVIANGAGEIKADQDRPEGDRPDDPEILEDMILAAVNEAIRSAHSLRSRSSAASPAVRSAASGYLASASEARPPRAAALRGSRRRAAGRLAQRRRRSRSRPEAADRARRSRLRRVRAGGGRAIVDAPEGSRELGPGDIFGERSLVDGVERTARVQRRDRRTLHRDPAAGAGAGDRRASSPGRPPPPDP